MANIARKSQEITINLGNYQSQKIGNSIELEQLAGETMPQLQMRCADLLQKAMIGDIMGAFPDDQIHARAALAMIGIKDKSVGGLRVVDSADEAGDGLGNPAF